MSNKRKTVVVEFAYPRDWSEQAFLSEIEGGLLDSNLELSIKTTMIVIQAQPKGGE